MAYLRESDWRQITADQRKEIDQLRDENARLRAMEQRARDILAGRVGRHEVITGAHKSAALRILGESS